MSKLTEHQSNTILKTGDGYDNAKAMEFATNEQKAQHSARVLEIGDSGDNKMAIEFATDEQKVLHAGRVELLNKSKGK